MNDGEMVGVYAERDLTASHAVSDDIWDMTWAGTSRAVTEDFVAWAVSTSVDEELEKGTMMTIQELVARLASLADDAKTLLPPPEPPAPPPPPPPVKQRLYVDGATIRTRFGDKAVLRFGESTYGASSAADTAKAFDTAKSIGFNGVAPLPNGPQFTITELSDMCVESLKQGLAFAVNVDHAGGMGKLTDPVVVALLNAQPHVLIECAVELGSGMSEAAWFDAAKGFVKQLRDAGHKSLLRVGSPDGGRSPRFALARGKELLAFDPEHNLAFTCQMYWSTTGSWYQGLNKFPGGIAGGLAALTEFAASGLAFLVGFDAEDDIGPTGFATLAQQANDLGVSWLWWELALDGRAANNLVSGGALSTTLTGTGSTVKGLLKGTTLPVF